MKMQWLLFRKYFRPLYCIAHAHDTLYSYTYIWFFSHNLGPNSQSGDKHPVIELSILELSTKFYYKIYTISYTPLSVNIREHFDRLFVHLDIVITIFKCTKRRSKCSSNVNCIIHKYISASVQHLYFVSGRP